jgi:hypothetical protein
MPANFMDLHITDTYMIKKNFTHMTQFDYITWCVIISNAIEYKNTTAIQHFKDIGLGHLVGQVQGYVKF